MLRAEQLGELRRLSEGGEGGDQPDVADIFTVVEAEADIAESSETGRNSLNVDPHALHARLNSGLSGLPVPRL